MKILLRDVTWRLLGLIVCETVVIVVAVYFAVWIRLGAEDPDAIQGILYKALLIAGITQLCLYFADLYDWHTIKDRKELFVRSVQALGATSLVLAGLYYWFP